MSELIHRIRVFVFRYERSRPEYLLLRGAQGIEAFWTPIHGPIGFGEKLETAIRREVMDDVGISKPNELIDLQMPARWLVGDEEVVEWNFGFHTSSHDERLRLDPRWADFRWSEFTAAYPSLELEIDRAAIMRLHTMLHAA
ncbi:MAG: NUDIX domain-containing protein [Planctomycetota bacterium]